MSGFVLYRKDRVWCEKGQNPLREYRFAPQDDGPNPSTHTFSFYLKLFHAWTAMRFRVPKVDFLNSDMEVK